MRLGRETLGWIYIAKSQKYSWTITRSPWSTSCSIWQQGPGYYCCYCCLHIFSPSSLAVKDRSDCKYRENCHYRAVSRPFKPYPLSRNTGGGDIDCCASWEEQELSGWIWDLWGMWSPDRMSLFLRLAKELHIPAWPGKVCSQTWGRGGEDIVKDTPCSRLLTEHFVTASWMQKDGVGYKEGIASL